MKSTSRKFREIDFTKKENIPGTGVLILILLSVISVVFCGRGAELNGLEGV